MRKITLNRMAVLAGLVVLGSSAHAFFDPTIAISKALGSNTLSVHYTGAHARTAELVINGQSMSTRNLDATGSSGDAYFTIDPVSLQDGRNTVEIKLYNVQGRMIGVKKTYVTAGQEITAPFILKTPKMGDTVQGAVHITVGMNQSFAAPYVSFFVDNKLRSFSNTPPFTFDWDTTAEANGWHQVQSWLVSDNSTYKTQSLRIFVNNPGGLTPRETQSAPASHPETRPMPVKTAPVSHPPVLPVKVVPNSNEVKVIPVKVTKVTPTVPPFNGTVALNPMDLHLAGTTLSTRPIQVASPLMAGAKHLVPKPIQIASHVAKNLVAIAEPNPARFVSITDGIRIPSTTTTGTFSILLNGAFVSFDVQPRIDQGIPMTPIRYLLEQDGGKVKWNNTTKTVSAQDEGQALWLKIGDAIAKVNSISMQLEKAPYIDGSRTIVPLSFIRDALHVDVQYDRTTNHVLITTKK